MIEENIEWQDIHKNGFELSFAKLIPSFVDRKPFFEMLLTVIFSCGLVVLLETLLTATELYNGTQKLDY